MLKTETFILRVWCSASINVRPSPLEGNLEYEMQEGNPDTKWSRESLVKADVTISMDDMS